MIAIGVRPAEVWVVIWDTFVLLFSLPSREENAFFEKQALMVKMSNQTTNNPSIYSFSWPLFLIKVGVTAALWTIEMPHGPNA